jgi:hypothetical protein
MHTYISSPHEYKCLINEGHPLHDLSVWCPNTDTHALPRKQVIQTSARSLLRSSEQVHVRPHSAAHRCQRKRTPLVGDKGPHAAHKRARYNVLHTNAQDAWVTASTCMLGHEPLCPAERTEIWRRCWRERE